MSLPGPSIGWSRNGRSITTLTIKMRPKIGPGDFDHKMEFVTRKLRQGEPIAVRIQLRGAEVLNPDPGLNLLRRVAGRVEGIAAVESVSPPSGPTIDMVLVPVSDGPPDSMREPRRPTPPGAESEGD